MHDGSNGAARGQSVNSLDGRHQEQRDGYDLHLRAHAITNFGNRAAGMLRAPAGKAASGIPMQAATGKEMETCMLRIAAGGNAEVRGPSEVSQQRVSSVQADRTGSNLCTAQIGGDAWQRGGHGCGQY